MNKVISKKSQPQSDTFTTKLELTQAISELKEREMRCYSVLIGEIYGVDVLASISDSVTPLLDLTQDGEALNSMFSI